MLLFFLLEVTDDVNHVVHQIISVFRRYPFSADGACDFVLLPLLDTIRAKRVHAVQRRGLQDKWQFVNL